MKKEEPIRIAHIIGKWVGGGVEAVVMNYYRHIDRSKIQFDFLCDDDSTNIPYEEIEELGGRVILIPPYQKIFKYQKELIKIFKENKYKIVHSHINTLSVFPLRAAKKAGVPVRIAHSHSTTNKQEWKKNLLKQILRPFSRVYATNYMCCSELAGRWLFGNKTYDSGKVYLLNNAIDLDKFKYDKKIRDKVRKSLNIKDDTLVIGHIGRFVAQKNHTFLIDIFNEVHKKNSNSILLLVGQGPLKEEIENKVNDLGLKDCVMFLGQRNDANELYQAFDVFLLPSLYEGLGMVLIEAQISGLPCYASTEVPLAAKVNSNINFLRLDCPEYWDKLILSNSLKRIKIANKNSFRSNGYDISFEALKLSKMYIDLTELFGLPGSGKSTWCSNNLNFDSLNVSGFSKNRFFRNVQKILYYCVIKIRYRKEYKIVKSVLKHFNFNSLKAKIKMSLYIYSIFYLIIANSDKSYVLDEGLLQVLWGICYNSSFSDDSVSHYIEKLRKYFSDKIIHLNVNQDLIVERLLNRQNSGGSELEHDIMVNSKSLEYAKSIEAMILEKLKNEFDVEEVFQ